MMKQVICAGVLALLPITAASAQTVVSWNAPTPAAGGQFVSFPMGTELQLTTRTELNTKQNHAGDRFYLEVAEPLVYHGQVVVPVGAVAVGEVMRSERNGHFGKKGKLDVRILYVQTPSGPVRLSGRSSREGKGQAALSIAGGIIVSWPMIFIHGTSGRLPADTPVTAYLADELLFAARPGAGIATASVYPDAPTRLPVAFNPSPAGRP